MVSELVLCGHCYDEQKPLTETNAVSILNWFQRDRDGNPACNATLWCTENARMRGWKRTVAAVLEKLSVTTKLKCDYRR